MAMSKSANTYNRQNWEESEFPILCQTCLGDNPYLRMTREKFGKECKICARPFTVFRWCPGARMRFKKTEICQTCSKTKNVCQTCLLDLEYAICNETNFYKGLPVQVRDAALNIDKGEIPTSDVGREYYTQKMERELANTDGTIPAGALGKARAKSEMLMKLARTTPYYKRNRPHICSFWVKGECKRGEECPYRHEKPTDPDDPLADQNIKDRFFGINDPVAEKLLRRYNEFPEADENEDNDGKSSSLDDKEKLKGFEAGNISERGPSDFFNLNAPLAYPPMMIMRNPPPPPPGMPLQPTLPLNPDLSIPPPMLPPPPMFFDHPRAPYPSQDPSRL